MSYSDSFSNCYDNNRVADDLSTVFDADTVVPDEVPSLPPLPPSPSAATTETEHHQHQAISSASSQEESPATTISELLRRINSQHPAIPIREEISINHHQSVSSSSSPKRLNNTIIYGEQNPPQETATATAIIDNSAHHSMKRPRRSSRLQQLQLKLLDQSSAVETSNDSEVEDENGLEDNEPNKINEEAVFNQSFPSSSQKTSTTRKKLNTYEVKWRSKFQELCDYKRLHGHANVLQSNSKLGIWVNNQRVQCRRFKANKNAFISNERIEMLESIGFEWERSKWNERFAELSEYKVIHGNTNGSMMYSKDYKQLGNWVNKQRSEYNNLKANKKSQITPERIQMLNSIGFQWSYRPGRVSGS